MPNIISQRVYRPDEGSLTLEIVGNDGRTFTLTKAQVQAIYQGTSGNAAQRRAAVVTEVKNRIVAALGPENIDPNELTYDFSTTDGSITVARIGNENKPPPP